MRRAFKIILIVGVTAVTAITSMISVRSAETQTAATPTSAIISQSSLPTVTQKSLNASFAGGIIRRIQLKTERQEDVSYKVRKYTVQSGDSLWSISQQFKLKPETILWGNDWLSSAGVLRIGDTLNILPVDGVLHTAKEGDTLDKLQILHGTSTQEIFEYIGNDFDLTQPAQLKAGQEIIVPGGRSPIIWSEAQPPSAQTESKYSGTYPNLGTGYFVWPLAPPYNLTQEYWGGHPAIDIDTYFRQPIFASDSGTVAFAGWDDTGYGNLVIIDHGNGYRTYYAHNEALLVSAGQTVVQGQQITESGSTGNSTGEHLDFRILYGGVFVNPLDYLP